ncbi:MAG: glutamate racemase [Candidatus Hydrogenedentes bacterium]|nr:glutamate racemase [Candidatus Hydrogenedentota bacterium]
MTGAHAPIGVFDSGVGGLTVARQIASRLPGEAIIYLGDTARVPYGTKSPETVIRYARACAEILVARDIKMMVVACNTASAFAVDALRDHLDVPVLGVIEPGARAAVRATQNGRIGVIGTSGTIRSGRYPQAIRALNPDLKVFTRPCPLFVPLAEEGWTRGEIPSAIAREYLLPLLENGIDTLVLGCTHYPLLKEAIAETAGETVTLVDSAEETAAAVQETLEAMGLCGERPMIPRFRFFVSDAPDSFMQVGEQFLGTPLHDIEWVDF